MPLRNAIVYDIETYPTFINRDGVLYNAGMKLSVAVTYDEKNDYKVWFENDVNALINYLLGFEKIIGFCIKNFDNAILGQYKNGIKESLDEKSIDMMETIEYRLGNRISLQSMTVPTLNTSKSGDGDQAIKWWLEGKKDLVVNYCKDDVKITKDLYLHGMYNGEILYESLGDIRKLKVDWNNPKAKFDAPDFTYRLIDDESGNFIDLDKDNAEFFNAIELAKTTNQIIYLTGKAGTGKTTFLKYLKKSLNKNTVVVAYTGVAALNAGGQTIHSFFQINPDEPPFVPDDKRLRFYAPAEDTDKTTIFNHFKYGNAKRELIESLDLLIIDEVSMLRADFADVIDKILRAFGRQRKLPFGGVQIILIGDLFQLSPIEGNEWDIMSQFYKSPFFFSSRIFETNPPIYIEFNKIYRQSEQDFINLLNRIRINQPSDADIRELNKVERIKPLTNELFENNYIVLCSTNLQAKGINDQRLNSIHGVEKTYVGEIKGQFPQNLWTKINDLNLRLKEGAQIMFLKNGTHYYNGKIGKIEKLEEDAILASTINNKGEKITFSIDLHTWKNVRYTYNKEQKKIEQELLGTFTQYPIKLAWAITIHKSQGLTFEKVVVDVSNFAPSGLVYVALSRCTSLNGLILRNPIPRTSINTDPRVIEFAQNITPDTLIVDFINQGKADTLYKEARHAIKTGKPEEAFQKLLSALKYRNDLETEKFKQFILVHLKKYSLYTKQFQNFLKSNKELQNKNSALLEKIEELEIKNQDLETSGGSLLADLITSNSLTNKLQEKVTMLEKENKKFKNTANKTKSENDNLINEISELNKEIERLQNLNWFEKILGKK